ncbi:hypothetical protein [Natronobacterium texcoconense]|uniref:Uncharacterized protein n=1 Tax=Natronobacterium texcoconense TaxID=1095778 RepID=A0A1H1CBR3_NATTX|nr:hypothetical protein [Natronobacterium texcoconense]SDQ61076.1 hypothetical protein SAMN04489842_1330 [Natronobacterium texcoconense]
MSALHFDSPVERRAVEPVLAALTILLAAAIVNESRLLFESVLELIWIPATILVPGLLACSVLVGVLAHGLRLGSALFGPGDRIRPGDMAVTRILASVVLGALAAYTLWWVVASLFVHYLVAVGGVSPVIWPPLFGGVLGALVLGRVVFFRLFPEGPLARLSGSAVE